MCEDDGSYVALAVGLVGEMGSYEGFFMFAYFILMIVLGESGSTWRGTSQRSPMESCWWCFCL